MGTGYPEKIDLFLQPGFLYGAPGPAVLRTVLAAGVAVCLWDPDLRIGGMNHFLFPKPAPDEPATPRTGIGATLGLIQALQNAGADTERLVAQILGGARRRSDPDDGTDLGAQNVVMARRLLERRAIGILSEDVGGTLGRKVIFDTQTGQLAVLKVHRLRDADWPRADN